MGCHFEKQLQRQRVVICVQYVPNPNAADGRAGTGSNIAPISKATAYIPGSPSSNQSDGKGVQSAGGGDDMSGTWNIPNGAQTDTVIGLGLNFTPAAVVLTVQSPDGGLALSAELTSDPTSDGFSYALIPGATDSADYILHFIISKTAVITAS
jgi:hypothetical protein